MQLAELISTLKIMQAGAYFSWGILYALTMLWPARGIESKERRWFTFQLAGIGWALGFDFLVSGLVGGTTLYLSRGGAVWPVYVLVVARVASILWALALIYTSYRSWGNGAQKGGSQF